MTNILAVRYGHGVKNCKNATVFWLACHNIFLNGINTSFIAAFLSKFTQLNLEIHLNSFNL